MIPTVTQTYTDPKAAPSVTQSVRDTGLRRRLGAELTGIGGQLSKFGIDDELSQAIQTWHEGLAAAFKTTADMEPILQTYIQLLQELLTSSIWPLDDQALLGSDGGTYGYKHLCLILNSIPEEHREKYRNRSPRDSDNPKPFTTSPHETVQYMIKWLKSYGVELKSEKIERSFKNLTYDEVRDIIPNERNNRLRRIRQVQVRRNKNLKANAEYVNETQHIFTEKTRKNLEPRRHRIDTLAKKTFQRLDTLEGKDQEQTRRLNEQADQLENEIRALDEDIDELPRKTEIVGNKISLVKREQIQIQKGIEEVEKAIEKKKEQEKKDLELGIVAFVVILAVASVL